MHHDDVSRPSLALIDLPLHVCLTRNLCCSLDRAKQSHFETTATDVLSLYERVTGKKLDLTIDPEVDPEEG